jgi:non-ribosomal peptide synthetase-like protein
LLHGFFERQALDRPATVAVECFDGSLTYAELDRRANQVARLLVERGVRPGDRVGLLLPRSTDLYSALLGILKNGAAYVPLDPEYPPDRIGFVLSDCGASALVTTKSLKGKAPGFQNSMVCLDEEKAALALFSAEKTPPMIEANSQDICYVIYTSGTTGRPKGIEIEHRSVCYLVRAEGEIFQVKPEDRVYQGFSIAFDASVEEVWLAFFAGATLVAATPEMACAGPGLPRLLAAAQVTVLSCVPTLLSMMDEDVPTVRLLILGGEVCPSDLVKRWWKPDRRIFNTYGPTEATVIATYSECHPGKEVTIGKPIPGSVAFVLDDALKPVSAGEAGELCLGGPCLARGYVNRDELTREKFVSVPLNGAASERVYRTGDRARWTRDGELEFVGRLDGQVKLRGFRVELSEIEGVLLEFPGIKAAAATVMESSPGVQQLVGYVVPSAGSCVELKQLREALRKRLPAYMVPAHLETLAALPMLASGKIDRKMLPRPGVNSFGELGRAPELCTPLETQIATVWKRWLESSVVSVRDDFFQDLGGHSLLAARVVSDLRKEAPFEQLSVLDLYRHPTIESLATKFERRQVTEQAAAGPSPFHSTPFWRHFWCGAAQFVSLGFILSFFALQWLAPYLAYTVMIEEEYDFWAAIIGAIVSLVALYPMMLTVPVVAKWLLIGRYKAGEYPLWGWFYFRWWLATTIEAAVPVAYLAGTPLLNIYVRFMGAKVGSNVHLNSNNIAVYDLIEIGSGSSINADAKLLGYTVEDGLLKLGRISVGSDCFVGARAALSEGTEMKDGSALEDLSLLPRSTTIPPGETWRGSPARKTAEEMVRREGQAGGESERASLLRRFTFGCLHGLGLLVFPVLVVGALFPGMVLMNRLNYLDPYYWYLLLSPLVGASFVVLLCLEIAALKWALLGKIKPGLLALHSFAYLRKWFVDQTLDLSLDILGPLYASVYLAPWYKLLGARLGKGAEISTASFISPDLLSIGEEAFIADNASLGAPRVERGKVAIGENRIGKRSFIGNSALLPLGSVIGDNVLIGCLSVPPSKPTDALREDTTWLGSPAVFLPHRQKSSGFGEETTFDPPAKLRVQRAVIEFVRVILPSTCFIILLSLLFSGLLLLHDTYDLTTTLLFFPLLYLGCGLAATLFTIAMKWLLVWRYRPGEKPLWSTFIWRNELLNALHEHLAGPFLVSSLTGTPFICWYFRLLGARIGRRVYMETTDLSEFDLVELGDETALNADCTIQTHLFEDRVMKMSNIDIGSRCRVGAGSLVLYDSTMRERASLGELSLLMKGEVLPAHTCWHGIPARVRKIERSRIGTGL